MKPLIVIPARLQATRLPGKPLARIGEEAMIVHVWKRAMEAKLGPVVVACDGEEIAQAVKAAGGEAVLTDAGHVSGSDRIWEAVEILLGAKAPGAADARVLGASTSGVASARAKDFDVIINLQGDVPTLDPKLLHALLEPLKNPEVDISTLVTPITRADEHTNPAVVKAVISGSRALYFSRASVPYGEGVRYHHIGVYAYRRAALQKFVSLRPSELELREKLEQLRALENGLRIDVAIVDTVPLGVDTPEDLQRARALLGV